MYRLTNTDAITRLSDSATIPVDQNNNDYRDYLAWVAAGNTPEPAIAQAPPVPDEISDRQFSHGLARQGIITETEALDWVGPGTLPAAIETFIAGLPATQQFDARMVLKGATIFKRSHPLTAAFGQAVGMSAAQIDAFWSYCAAL